MYNMETEKLIEEIAELKGNAIVNKGTIEILISYIYVKLGKDDFNNFLRSVSDSGKFSNEATIVAKKFLDLDSVFGEHIFQPGQSEQ